MASTISEDFGRIQIARRMKGRQISHRRDVGRAEIGGISISIDVEVVVKRRLSFTGRRMEIRSTKKRAVGIGKFAQAGWRRVNDLYRGENARSGG